MDSCKKITWHAEDRSGAGVWFRPCFYVVLLVEVILFGLYRSQLPDKSVLSHVWTGREIAGIERSGGGSFAACVRPAREACNSAVCKAERPQSIDTDRVDGRIEQHIDKFVIE